MANDERAGEKLHGEEAIIRLLAPLAQGYPGAFGLTDDCAVVTPEPGTELVLKTDPVAEGVHFLAGDAPEGAVSYVRKLRREWRKPDDLRRARRAVPRCGCRHRRC